MEPISFEQFRDSLQPIGTVATIDAVTRASIQAAADALAALPTVSRETLAGLLKAHPDWVPHVALCCRLSQERLKSALKHGLGTAGWVTVARNQPEAIVELLDNRFDLVAEVTAQRTRVWTFGDVLVERQAARTNAKGTVGVGKQLEDEVEALVRALGLKYEMRTKFLGRYGRQAPCDIAIPEGGDKAEIVIAIKSFGSTGSKQSDAAREFVELAEVHASHQYAFGFLDGIGWLRRQSDLRRIFDQWENRQLDGVFNLAMAAEFQSALDDAARRRNLLVEG